MTSQYCLRPSFTVVKMDVSNLDRGFVEQLKEPGIKHYVYGSL